VGGGFEDLEEVLPMERGRILFHGIDNRVIGMYMSIQYYTYSHEINGTIGSNEVVGNARPRCGWAGTKAKTGARSRFANGELSP
jgi:hypothetical protein